MSDFWQICCEYGRYYCEGVVAFWKHLRPTTYASALFLVWAIGFALLKSGAKRP